MTALAGIVPPCNVAGLGEYAAWADEYKFNIISTLEVGVLP